MRTLHKTIAVYPVNNLRFAYEDDYGRGILVNHDHAKGYCVY